MLPPVNFLRTGFLILLFSFLLSTSTVKATAVILPSDDDLITGARAIVRAKVNSITAAARQEVAPFRYVTLDVLEVFKGPISTGEIVLKEQGGQTDDLGSIAYGTPEFRPQEEVFLYLDTWPDGSLRVYQMFLGKYSILRDQVSGISMITRDKMPEDAFIVGGPPAGTLTSQEELNKYCADVRARVRANEERSRQFAATYYGDSPLLMKPQEFEAKAGGGGTTRDFTTQNPAACWFDVGNNQPIVYFTNTDGAPYPQVEDDIAAALNVWSSLPGSRLRMISGGFSRQCTPIPGAVLIAFNNCDGRWSPSPDCSGILAQTVTWYLTSASRQLNGKVFYKMTQAFVSVNPYISCQFTDHCRIQEVVTHEIGHSLGMGHSWTGTTSYPTDLEMDATMYPVIHFDNRGASLRLDDITGIRFIYPPQNLSAAIAITTGTPLPTYILGSQFKQVLSLNGGSPPYTWTVVTNGGELPPGVTLSANGELSGTPSATGNYSFTVQANDSTFRMVKKVLSMEVIDGPLIHSMKYKSNKRQLTITGERLGSVSSLLIDGVAMSVSRTSDSTIVIKKLNLSAGIHAVRAISAAGLASNLAVLEVK